MLKEIRSDNIDSEREVNTTCVAERMVYKVGTLISDIKGAEII